MKMTACAVACILTTVSAALSCAAETGAEMKARHDEYERWRDPVKLKEYLDAGGAVDGATRYNSPLREVLAFAPKDKVREMVELLIAYGARANVPGEWKSSTYLHDAMIHQRSPEVVDILLKAGADVNGRATQCYTVEEFTPLHVAALHGNSEIAAVLLAHGATVNAHVISRQSHHYGFYHSATPLHLALHNARTESPIKEKEILKTMSLLIEKGADVNARDDQGASPLHYAATKDEVQLLLDHGADPFAVDAHRRQPQGGTLESIQLLIQRGGDVLARDADGRTRLFGVNNPDVAEWLIAQGVNPNQGDNQDMKPLHVAGNVRAMKVLVAHGANVNAADALGNTPLITRARPYTPEQSNPIEIAEFLVSKGASVLAVNKQGNTALLDACEHRNKELVRLFVEHGADLNASHNTFTVWKLAEGDNEILAFLKEHEAKK